MRNAIPFRKRHIIANSHYLHMALMFFLAMGANGQIQAGLSYGANYDFGRNTPNGYQSKGIFDINLIYKNQSRLSPFISVAFTKIPLNYSEVIVKNQGDFKTVAINNSTSVALGVETLLKEGDKSDIFVRFGFGINIFSNPTVSLENSHVSFGQDSNYSPGTETKFPFLDLSFKVDRQLSEHWTVNFSPGTAYYPKDNAVTIVGNINQTDVEVNSTFSKLRPYAKIGIARQF